jgi:hypothetical protein
VDRPTEKLKPIGFWSYARQDDRASREALTKLRLLLKLELEQQYGEELELFQDVGAIPHGAEWEREIRHAISKSTFFIPIVTPRFLRSEWCGKEMRLFVERQNELCALYPELAEESLIFPILYVDVKDVEPLDPQAFAEITKRQYLDFRQLRLANYESEPVGRALEKLASDICEVLRRRLKRAPTPEEIAEVRRKEDEERRQREEEAERDRERVRAQADRLAAEAEAKRREEAARRDAEERDRLRLRAETDARVAVARAARSAKLRALSDRSASVARSVWPWALGAVVGVTLIIVALRNAPEREGADMAVHTPATGDPVALNTSMAEVAVSPDLVGRWALKGHDDACPRDGDPYLLAIAARPSDSEVEIGGKVVALPAPDNDGWRHFGGGYWRVTGDVLHVAATHPESGELGGSEYSKCP